MNNALTVTKIIDIYRSDNNQNWQRNFFDIRKFDGIIFFTQGEIKYHFKNKDITAKKGDILFLPGNLPYSGKKATDSISFFVIDFLCLLKDEFEKIGAPCVIKSKNFDLLLSFIPKIKHIWDNHLLNSDFEIKSFVYSVLSEIYKQDENLKKSTPTDTILEFISKRIVDSELSLKEICDNFFISESQLRRNIYKRTGLSPNEYITMLRINKAKNELSSTDKPIKAISSECGFASPYYFSKVFSKTVGISPSQYRIQILHWIKFINKTVLKTAIP